MKKSLIFTFGALISSALLTSCLDEVFPTSGVTEAQLSSSTKAAEATLAGMSAQTIKYNVLGRGFHYDWGVGALMHIRDVMTADVAVVASGYDQFGYFERNQAQGDSYTFAQVQWNTYYKMILTANSAIAGFPADAENTTFLGYRAQALAYRAWVYLDAARQYEFLPNDVVSGVNADHNDVTGLTIPIVTNETSQQAAGDNPRATHEEMYEFIKSDLTEAESLISYASQGDKTKASTGVVYGLFARLYMWNGEYAKAAEYARKAIDLGVNTPMTESQWLDPATGFNTIVSSWMFASQYAKEDGAVQSGIVNWASWSANEAEYGYCAAGPNNMISAELYDRMNDTDFRKLAYKAPAGSALEGQEPFIDPEWANENLADYAGIKFRPGQGDMYTYLVGNVVAIPLMRIEEMYFIEAEAIAHSDATTGKQLLENFVKTFRDPAYVCQASGSDEVVEEIFQQKRIEFWLEGIIWYDYKRLDHSVTRAYEGTNFQPAALFNTSGRPAWMNTVITRQEVNNNVALAGWNNPDFSDKYPVIVLE